MENDIKEKKKKENIALQTYEDEDAPKIECMYTVDSRSNDIASDMTICSGQKEIIRNARFGGTWGSEEKHGGMPLMKNKRFQLQILVEP